MSTRADMLALRRQQLLAQSASLRGELEIQRMNMTRTLESAQIGLRILDRLRQHPGWIIGIAAGLAMLKPSRLSAALRMGTDGLRAWRQISPALQNIFMRQGQ